MANTLNPIIVSDLNNALECLDAASARLPLDQYEQLRDAVAAAHSAVERAVDLSENALAENEKEPAQPG